MFKILLVDDRWSNNMLLEMLIEKYVEEHEIDKNRVVIQSTDSGTDAVKIIFSQQDIDLIFLDLMMPKMSGMDVLDIVRSGNIAKDPKIIICTALDDEEVKSDAELKHANAFITKPVTTKMINAMLDRYLMTFINETKINQEQISNTTEDDDIFIDFDNGDDEYAFNHTHKESLEHYNSTHLKLSAQEFLSDVENVQYYIEDSAEIENDLFKISNNLDADSIEQYSMIISECLGKYSNILIGFVEFYELSLALRALSTIIKEADFGDRMSYKYKTNISLYVQAIFEDIVNWREHVFILQDAVDVYYLNASVLSSCIQLEDMIKKSYEL